MKDNPLLFAFFFSKKKIRSFLSSSVKRTLDVELVRNIFISLVLRTRKPSEYFKMKIHANFVFSWHTFSYVIENAQGFWMDHLSSKSSKNKHEIQEKKKRTRVRHTTQVSTTRSAFKCFNEITCLEWLVLLCTIGVIQVSTTHSALQPFNHSSAIFIGVRLSLISLWHSTISIWKIKPYDKCVNKLS